MDWLEFAVVLACGIFGFIVVNYMIDQHRSLVETSQKKSPLKNDQPDTKERTDQGH